MPCASGLGSASAARVAFWLKLSVIAVLVVVLYASVIQGLIADWWNEPALSQGLLVVPVAAIVAWSRRQVTLAQAARPATAGSWLIGAACGLLLLGKFASEFFLMRISLLLLLAGLVWTFWGARRLRTLSFPMLLVAAAIPLPALVYNAASAPLQLFASNVGSRLAQLFGVTVYRDGNTIHLAGASLGVEEACSGLNSLSALMIASLLLGFLHCSSLRMRALLFALSLPIAIAINIVRISGTAVMADYDGRYAMGFYHSFSGWLVFLIGAAALYGAARALEALSGGRSA